MKKIALAACLALTFALPSAYAQSAAPVDPDTAAAVKELLVVMHTRDNILQMMAQMQKNMPAMMLQGATAAIKNNPKMTEAQKNEAIAKAAKEVPQAAANMASTLNDPAMWDEMLAEFVPLCARHFTAAELREMAAFYKTPVGMKVIATMPQLAGESMQISQKVMMPRLNALMQKMVKPQ